MSAFAVGRNSIGLFGRGERLKIGIGGGRWCQVLDAVFEPSRGLGCLSHKGWGRSTTATLLSSKDY
jgi:hypothetical protein